MTTSEALAYFDGLEPVSIEFMLGQWHGSSFSSGHPYDGLLEKYSWYGKRFMDTDNVHPLVYRGLRGRLVPVDPGYMPLPLLRFRIFHMAVLGKIFQLLLPVYKARRSGARLRMIEYRGKTSAAMIYDKQPIIDVFRKIDDAAVLGMMDLKGMKQPYFFKLARD